MMKLGEHAILHYRLAPSEEARAAIEDTFVAYGRMFDILRELASDKGGANLVTLHELAYETVREHTSLPARLVTLGLRDFASMRGQAGPPAHLPLDDKLFAIKGPSDLTIATVHGRVAVPYDVAGYSAGALNIFAAELVSDHGTYEVRVSVTTRTDRTEDMKMMTSNEGILSRMGRLIAGAANSAIDRLEDVNKISVVEQALREIDAAADEARTDIGRSKAEEYRIGSRRTALAEDFSAMEEKIRIALSSGREDLAKAGVSRQIDLEAQIAALDKALSDARANIEEGQQALQAVLATRREVEARLTELRRSEAQHPVETIPGRVRAGNGAARAASAVSRVTGVPAGANASNAELDELDRLHREQAIEARLAQIKMGRNPS
jgi:phage shock protein A